MKQSLLRTSALALMVGSLAACNSATTSLKPPVDTVQYKFERDVVKRQVELVPDWFKKMPEEDGSVFAVGTSVSPSLQLSVDSATLNAKFTLADRIKSKLRGQMKSYVAKVGQGRDMTVAHELEKAMKNLIADVDVSGYSQKEIEVYTAGNKYRVYVLLEYSDAEATKIIMNRIRKDRILYSKLKASKGWRELDDAVEKSHKDDDSNTRALHELEFGKSGESS